MQIIVPITFTGAGATEANVAAMRADIASRWSGSYTIDGHQTNIEVSVPSAASHGVMNTINLVNGPTSQGASFVSAVGGTSGEWNAQSAGMAQGEAAHEAGHLMGERDRYHENGTDAAGHRQVTVDPGFEHDLMGVLGTRPDSRNISAILNNPSNVNITPPAAAH